MKKGFTLIELLAVIVILTVIFMIAIPLINGFIIRAKQEAKKNDFLVYREEYALFQSILTMHDENQYVIGASDLDVKNYVASLKAEDIGKIAIYENKLVYLYESEDDIAEKEIAEQAGLETMLKATYTYYVELKIVEQLVKQVQETCKTTDYVSECYLGKAIETTAHPSKIDIRGINYGYGWYYLDAVLLKDQGIDVLNGPYIVKYTLGAVQSVPGKMIDGIAVHTLNYTGEEDGFYIRGLLSGVDANSARTTSKWGELSINNGTATYDSANGLSLGTQIAELAIDQSRPVNERYSINITIKGIVPQTIIETFPRTIVAISDTSGSYVSWIGIRGQYLHIYSFYGSSARGNVDKEETVAGFMSIDLTKAEYGFDFNNQYLNIQVTAEIDGQTKVYINGTLFKSFSSGSGKLSYGKITIGDLRSGRGLKYMGSIYNFALYSDILDEDSIKQNWNYTKAQLNIT